jgi:hypothetical protein
LAVRLRQAGAVGTVTLAGIGEMTKATALPGAALALVPGSG